MRILMATVVGLALAGAACGSDGDGSPSEPVTSESEPVTSESGPVTAESAPPTAESEPVTSGSEPVAAAPERIVSLSPTHTEIMFAIGADDLLVAVDDQSNFPAAALELPNDLSGFEPNVEAIAGYEPDLVLIGGDFSGLSDQLATVDIDSWDGPAATAFADTYAQIEQLGEITGHADEASDLVMSMQTSIDEIVENTPASDTPLTYFHELGPELFTATSSTFIGQVYGLFGLENIADPLEADSGQYPQLSAEFLVEENPDLIFLADTKCCGESAATVAAREGFDTVAAVANDDVVELDDDVASRWGPRIVDYVAAVAAAVDRASTGA